ncbi:MAG: lipopolysaccharide biosynthesis protein, partial [Acidobacteriota bacterium]|nr:lipopolysaccharide biosynthesis protein [Acidobacteriota bacterium]
LKSRTVRGGFAKVCSQGANLTLRLGSLMILARLLDPKDFGLVGMVTAVTGVFHIFKDFGLSTATVQRVTVTEEQISSLFWINVLVGAILGILSVVVAPTIAAFYHDPRLFAVTAILGLGFLFDAAGVQHSAILQRQMRFTALAAIETASLSAGIAVGIVLALRGYGYWALVATIVVTPLASAMGVWLTAAWLPGPPRRHVGVRSMIGFGGTLTLNGLVAYAAYNMEKVLLGRFWGADALGIYGRGYQIANLPTSNLNSAVGGVAFSALSRLQNEPGRLRTYFLKGYSLVLTLTIPITVVCALFAHDVVLVILGAKWTAAVIILRLLAPTIVVFALINPLGWLLYSLGLVGRSLKIALVFAPIVVVGYVIGLPYGPKGVALAYSAVMILWVIPHVAWCMHGTMISIRDVLVAASLPLASGIAAGALAFGLRPLWANLSSPFPRLALESTVVVVTFFALLLFVAGQKSIYVDLLRTLKGSAPVEEKRLVSA